MKKKRMVSIIFIGVLCIMLVVSVKMKLFENFIIAEAGDTANEAGTAAEVQPPANQGTNPYSKGDKVLDDTYLHGMNEDVFVKSSYGLDMNIRVTDSFLTRDVTEYYSLMREEIYYNDLAKEHVDSNGIFMDDYFYLVNHVTITNVGTEKGECLIPGIFRYVFLKDRIAQASPSGFETRHAAKMEGNGNATLKGHLILEAGESYTYALISFVDEASLDKYAGEGKEIYLGTTTCSIYKIPYDGDLVRFIKLDLTER